MSITVIHGPQGTGKTRYANTFKAHFGCNRIVDCYWPGEPVRLRDGDLVLTSDTEEHLLLRVPALSNATFIQIEAAKKAAGIR